MKHITTIKLKALDGKKTIADAKEVFNYIDSDFKNWNLKEDIKKQL